MMLCALSLGKLRIDPRQTASTHFYQTQLAREAEGHRGAEEADGGAEEEQGGA